jgi:hypothetical protein
MPLRTAACLLAVLIAAAPGSADGVRPVCDLSAPAVIGAFTSGDSEVSVGEGPTEGSNALRLVFKPVSDWPSARYELPAAQDWSTADLLVVTLRNDGPATANIEVGVVDARGKAYKPSRRIPPGRWVEMRIPVLGMISGTDEGAWCGEAIDASRVVRFWFLAYSPTEPLPVRFADIHLVKLPRLPAPVVTARGASDGVALWWNEVPGARCYDIFRRTPGASYQRLARFPAPRFVDISAVPEVAYQYRVVAVNELGRHGAGSRPVRASAAPQAEPALPALDRYGGRADIQLAATGFFHLERLNGRWVLVDPEGHPMLSVGICVLSLGDTYTRVTRREALFKEALAERADPRFRAAWEPPYGFEAYGLDAATGLVFSPYVRNQIARFGPDWRARWRERTIQRLVDWHVNTVAAWGATDLQHPYVSFTAGWGDTPCIPTVDGHVSVPDVFDPAFERNATASAQKAAALADDPWLIGWFTSNEMGWYGDWQRGSNLVNLIHAAPATFAAKTAWLEHLKGRYPDIAALNAAWGTGFSGFDAILANRDKLPGKPAARRDASEFLAAFARRYFRITSEAIRRNDPHHLILGARHSQGAPPEVIMAESSTNDVVSATIYGFSPRRPVESGSTDTDRPWIAGEFHFQSLDAGLPVRAVEGVYPTQVGRGDAYQDYLSEGFSMPNFIGAHWFEYIDEPATGRFDQGKDGGEAHNIGWVNVEDEPYTEFVVRARLINANLPLLLR